MSDVASSSDVSTLVSPLVSNMKVTQEQIDLRKTLQLSTDATKLGLKVQPESSILSAKIGGIPLVYLAVGAAVLGVIVMAVSEPVKATANRKVRRNGTVLPSEEEGGKPSHDKDFAAGFIAGTKALRANDTLSSHDAKAAFRKVRGHGSWWVDGFVAAIDLHRGSYKHKGVQIAKKMGLDR